MIIKVNSDNFWREDKYGYYGIKHELTRLKLNPLQSFLMEKANEKFGKKIYNMVYNLIYYNEIRH